MKTVKVVAAIIIHENKIFATQRGYGEFKDGWEFPGGKIEPGETPQEALVREIREELAAGGSRADRGDQGVSAGNLNSVIYFIRN